jgi:hypothetical protein
MFQSASGASHKGLVMNTSVKFDFRRFEIKRKAKMEFLALKTEIADLYASGASIIILDEGIKRAILAKVPQADFSDKQLIKKGTAFLQVNMYFSGHTIQPGEKTVKEAMRMVITTPGREQPNIIYEKRIVFDYEKFQYYRISQKEKASAGRSFWMWLNIGSSPAFSNSPQSITQKSNRPE